MISTLYFICLALLTFGDKKDRPELDIKNISPDLFVNANTVIRSSKVHHHIKNSDDRITKVEKTITVLNENGKSTGNFTVGYSEKSDKIKDVKIFIYDSMGKRISEVDKDDIQDLSSSYGSLASSGRYKLYNHITNKYPYTIHYEYTFKSSNTLNLQTWWPVYYNQSVENSEYLITSDKEFPVMTKGFNFDSVVAVKKTLSSTFSLSKYPAIKYERMAPHYKNILPHMLVCPNQFSFEGIDGSITGWKDFGDWFYKLNDTQDNITESMISELEEIVEKEDDNYTKAKKIYDYVAENMRYVSIQLGIGGFQPFPAEEVHHLKYGDCKGLSNYTKTLMNHFGINALYTVIESDINYNYNFDTSMPDLTQGNHVILCLPDLRDTTFVECTSKDLPFGYISSTNNNRNVLLVTAEGGKVVKTTRYHDEANVVVNQLKIICDDDFNAEVSRITKYKNLALDSRMWRKDLTEMEKQKMIAKTELNHFSKYDLKSYSIELSRDQPLLEEGYSFSIPQMAKEVGYYKMLPLHLFSLYTSSIISADRIQDIEIKDGYRYDIDMSYVIPDGYTLVDDNNSFSLNNSVGTVSYKISMIDSNTVNVTANILQKSGRYDSSVSAEYNFFQDAKRQFSNSMIVLKPKK